MMTLRTQIIVIIIVLIGILALVNLVRKKSIELKYALIWFFVGIVVLVFAIFPILMDYLTGIFGMASPVNMLFFVGFILVILVMLSLTAAMSSSSVKIKKVIQENAILKDEIKKLKNSQLKDKELN